MGDDIGVNESNFDMQPTSIHKIFTSIVFDHLDRCISTPILEHGLTILMIQKFYKDETSADAIQHPKLSMDLELASDACPQHGHVITLYLLLYVHHLRHTSFDEKPIWFTIAKRMKRLPIQSNNQHCRTWSGILRT